MKKLAILLAVSLPLVASPVGAQDYYGFSRPGRVMTQADFICSTAEQHPESALLQQQCEQMRKEERDAAAKAFWEEVWKHPSPSFGAQPSVDDRLDALEREIDQLNEKIDRLSE